VIAGLALQRDAALAAIDAEIAGIEGEATRRHDLHMAAIEEIQDAAKVAHDQRMAAIESLQAQATVEAELRAAQMDALREQIAQAEELEAAVKGMAAFIDQLKQGPLGPGNPADKLALAQDSFAKALAAYTANPTAQGLTGLQGLAQTMLSLAEPIFSKPSPQFQALSATTIKQLLAAEALAAGMMSDSEVLKAQLAALQAADKAATQGVADQIKAIQDADKAAATHTEDTIKAIQDLDTSEQNQAKDLIAKLNEQKIQIGKDFETQTDAIEEAFKTQKTAIEDAAETEIAGIQEALKAELLTNFDKQIPLLAAQYDAALAQLTAIGDTKTWQDATLGKLEEIRVALASVIPAESGKAYVTEGLYHLHGGEAVLPKGMADQFRAAGGAALFAGGIPAMADGGGLYGPVGPPNQWYPDDSLVTGFRARQLRGEIHLLESRIRVLQHGHMTARDISQLALLTEQLRLALIAPPTPPPYRPPTPPPTTPPYVPPGPGWLTRTNTAQMGGGGGDINFHITIQGDVKDEQKLARAIADEMLPLVQGDAKNGKLGVIIDRRAKSVR